MKRDAAPAIRRRTRRAQGARRERALLVSLSLFGSADRDAWAAWPRRRLPARHPRAQEEADGALEPRLSRPAVSASGLPQSLRGAAQASQATSAPYYGGVGLLAGKSHLAAAIGLAPVENGWRVLFTRTTDLVQRLQVARRELALERALRQARQVSPARPRRPRVLFELIGTRYERRSMLITANQPFGEWGKVFPDQAMTLAAIDRLVHHAHHPGDERRELRAALRPRTQARTTRAGRRAATFKSDKKGLLPRHALRALRNRQRWIDISRQLVVDCHPKVDNGGWHAFSGSYRDPQPTVSLLLLRKGADGSKDACFGAGRVHLR